MIVPAIDRRSGHHRIAYTHLTRLSCALETLEVLPAAARLPLEQAQVTNLSEGGMFVTTDTPLPVGTEVRCALPVSPEPSGDELALAGKVVWTATGASAGMGLQFLAPDDHTRVLLRQAIAAEHPLPWSRSVKLWLEGTPQPIRARAFPAPGGAVIEAELGFLRLNSPVLLCFDDEAGESYCGTLVTVAVRSEPEEERPYLQLQVDVAQPWKNAGDTWTQWPPLVASLADASEEAPSPVAHECATQKMAAARTPTLELPPVVVAPDPAEAPLDASPLAVVIAPQSSTAAAPVVELTARTSAAGAFCPPPAQPEPALAPLASVETDLECLSGGALSLLPLATETAYSLDHEPQAISQWDLRPLNLAGDSDWDLVTELPADKHPPRYRLQLWLWAAALLMVSTTVASMVHTNLWSRAQDKLAVWLPELAALVDQGTRAVQRPAVLTPELPAPRHTAAPRLAAEPTPSRPVSAVAAGSAPANAVPPATAPATAAAQKLTPPTATLSHAAAPALLAAPTPKPSTPSAALSGAAPHVRQNQAGAQLVIPLEGSLAGATHYTLIDPLALAINLPRASARAGLGSYALREGGFRRLWVRSRDGGVHLRVFFTEASAKPVLTLGAQEIVVTLPGGESGPSAVVR